MSPLDVLGHMIVRDVSALLALRHGRGAAALVMPLPDSEDLDDIVADRRRRLDHSAELAAVLEDQSVPHGSPVAGGQISSGFGMRIHPVSGSWKQHEGVDIAVPVGTEVSAIADGRVTFSGGSPHGYGPCLVMIDHGNGYVTRYAHLSEVLVLQGELVKRGDVVGRSGSAGTGPHLHYEVLYHGEARDPRAVR